MERHDVQRELQKQILRDCEGVKNLNFQSGEDVALLTRRGDLLTVQVKSRQNYMNSHAYLLSCTCHVQHCSIHSMYILWTIE